LETNLSESRQQLEEKKCQLGEARKCSQALRQQMEALRQQNEEASACGDRAEARSTELQSQLKEAMQHVQGNKDELQEAVRQRSMLQTRCNGLEESLQQERDAQKALEERVRSASEAAAAEGSPDSASQALASSNAVLAVAEAEAQQARREQRRLEQVVAAAREAVIRMGPRLGVLAGQEVSTTSAGENCFQQGGLEDAVAACEVLMPKLEQRAQDALAAREEAENRAAECERQLLDVATTTSTFHASSPTEDRGLASVNNAAADRIAGLEGQQSAGGRRVVSASAPRQTCVERGRCTVS